MTDRFTRFEKACRSAGMEPVAKIETKHGDILIADGVSNGSYKTMWSVSRNGIDIAQPLEFDLFHNPELSTNDKRQARINAAKKEAFKWLGHNVESGRYDA